MSSTTPPGATPGATPEEEGFEALHRLYAEAVHDDFDNGRICARLLLGLYNGLRFPFDLTDLRLLQPDLFEDAMAVIRMDARHIRQEVHLYFAEGSRKFETLVSDYRVVDVQRLKATGDGSARPPAERGALHHEDEVSARLVTCGDAPGYRDVSLVLDCEVIGEHVRRDVGAVRLHLRLNAADSERVMEHVREVHTFAWRDPRGLPLDAEPGEKPPRWLREHEAGA